MYIHGRAMFVLRSTPLFRLFRYYYLPVLCPCTKEDKDDYSSSTIFQKKTKRSTSCQTEPQAKRKPVLDHFFLLSLCGVRVIAQIMRLSVLQNTYVRVDDDDDDDVAYVRVDDDVASGRVVIARSFKVPYQGNQRLLFGNLLCRLLHHQ